MDLTPSRPSAAGLTTAGAASAVASALGPRPGITVYRPGGERIELSGAVLANWAAKTAGLLTEELDLMSGERIALSAEWGWRAPAFALGAWAAGLDVLSPDDDDAAAAHLATDSPEEAAQFSTESTALQRCILLPRDDTADRWEDASGAAFAEAFPDAGRDVCDYAALVRGFADVFTPFEPVTGAPLAVSERWAGAEGAGRVLIQPASPAQAGQTSQSGAGRGPGELMRAEDITSLAALLAGGQGVVVVLDPQADIQRIAESEKARPLNLA
ncbi:TIGR03089 family protein [Falsarthrobacter nasiphocae]|uniref:Uncharacterized protein (TIGR03089 family) n=1 Tax=Falsarthrobacter nasiphocae TaxID=189863 RepID=A0AAE3YG55_9MICC|nr:TIGR03089 family protein [Falsarthrobacter nasiphocae]MDR6891627.1 uncharacterized protein (TIGR03089 family) [Falsarthrobacter nasiphocae]